MCSDPPSVRAAPGRCGRPRAHGCQSRRASGCRAAPRDGCPAVHSPRSSPSRPAPRRQRVAGPALCKRAPGPLQAVLFGEQTSGRPSRRGLRLSRTRTSSARRCTSSVRPLRLWDSRSALKAQIVRYSSSGRLSASMTCHRKWRDEAEPAVHARKRYAVSRHQGGCEARNARTTRS